MDGIENLRTFVAVAEAGSLASAARELGVAASVVTKRIDQLESRVRARLFTRTTRRVALTEMGLRYLSSARRLMQDYDEVFAEMSHSPQQIEGNIRIKVPTSMTVGYLAETLAEFQQQFPLVSLDVALIDRAVNPSAEGFDIAVAGLPISFPGVIDELICPLQRFACAAPSYIEERGGASTSARADAARLSRLPPHRRNVAFRKRRWDRQRRPAAEDERERHGRADGGSVGGEWHRPVAIVRSGGGAPCGHPRSSARGIHRTDGVDEGARTRGSCWHPARAVLAHVPEGTLFPRAAMGQGHLTPDGAAPAGAARRWLTPQ